MKTASPQELLVCSCQRSIEIDGEKLAAALGQPNALRIHTELCRRDIGVFEGALAKGVPIHIACTQEAPLFKELAEEKNEEARLTFTNIRERAGWCEAKASALPKMAALLAEAAYSAKPTGVTTLTSEGVCLVYGAGQVALDAAHLLADRLSVTVLLRDTADALPPDTVSVPIYKGRIRTASGHLGAFEIEVDDYAPMLPSSRGSIEFLMPQNGAHSTCDLILDLSGAASLFPAGHRRDGYVRVDPNDPVAVARALFDIVALVGEFEKPLYVSYDAAICAHSRSQKVGCTNCLDNCPVGAISPNGDGVAFDAAICGGCGSCSAVCPTGAAGYAFPQRADLLARISVLLKAYTGAGGQRPVILFHDERHGTPMIGVMARVGRGLPVNVLPVSLYSVLQLGHDALAATLALGAEQVVVLAPADAPEELAGIEGQVSLLGHILEELGHEGARAHILVERDPDIVEAFLYDLPPISGLPYGAFAVIGSKREVARMALGKLHAASPRAPKSIALHKGAPYGRIHISTERCTLCLACVGACPANALADNPERPEVAFTEAACVQCGVCAATCPEQAISLEPRYNFASSALSPEVLNAEEPFHCVSCGKPFGSKKTIDRVLNKLKGHAMFRDEAQSRVIQMCDTCRVVSWSTSNNDPYKGAPPPVVRTTQDYLDEEAAEQTAGRPLKPEDFVSYRLALDAIQQKLVPFDAHAKEADEALDSVDRDGLTLIEVVEDVCRLLVQSNMPAPVRILDLRAWLHVYIDPQEMGEPLFDDASKRIQRRLTIAEVDHRIEPIRALPIDTGVLTAQNVERHGLHGHARFGEQLSEPRLASRTGLHLDDLLVGQHHAPLFGACELLAEEELGGPQSHRIRTGSEDAAQHDVHHLINEHGRERNIAALHEPEVRALDRARLHQNGSECENNSVGFQRVGIGDLQERCLIDRSERIRQQSLMKAYLGIAGRLDRVHLGAGVVGAKKLRRHSKPAFLIVFEEMQAGRFPEVMCRHL